MIAHDHNGNEFEVTEADMALVAPLGVPGDMPEDLRTQSLIFELKQALAHTNIARVLPTGYWDCFPDEGEWRCNEPTCQDHSTQMCGIPEHMAATRGYDSARDDVFVRLNTAISPLSPIWDLEVFTRNRTVEGGVGVTAVPCINGEEYTPEHCVEDLGALLSVFRLFINQGRL